MSVSFETADRLARETLDAGPVGEERPCDCIRDVDGWWFVNGCDCGNTDDACHAQDWCCTENSVVKVRNLILELTK